MTLRDVTALGAMTYGEPGRGYPTWTLAEEESRPLIRQAVEAGDQLLRHRELSNVDTQVCAGQRT